MLLVLGGQLREDDAQSRNVVLLGKNAIGEIAQLHAQGWGAQRIALEPGGYPDTIGTSRGNSAEPDSHRRRKKAGVWLPSCTAEPDPSCLSGGPQAGQTRGQMRAPATGAPPAPAAAGRPLSLGFPFTRLRVLTGLGDVSVVVVHVSSRTGPPSVTDSFLLICARGAPDVRLLAQPAMRRGLWPYAENATTGDQVAMSGDMKFILDLLSFA